MDDDEITKDASINPKKLDADASVHPKAHVSVERDNKYTHRTPAYLMAMETYTKKLIKKIRRHGRQTKRQFMNLILNNLIYLLISFLNTAK